MLCGNEKENQTGDAERQFFDCSRSCMFRRPPEPLSLYSEGNWRYVFKFELKDLTYKVLFDHKNEAF